MKYQNAGKPKYWVYSPWMQSMKWNIKKKKFHTKLADKLRRLKLSANC